MGIRSDSHQTVTINTVTLPNGEEVKVEGTGVVES